MCVCMVCECAYEVCMWEVCVCECLCVCVCVFECGVCVWCVNVRVLVRCVCGRCVCV